MFTPEIITLLGSSILGGALKLWSKSMENQRHLLDIAITKGNAADNSHDKGAARGGPMARRFIVVVCMFTVFLAPFVLAAWFPSVPIFYAYSEAGRGFWFLIPSIESMRFVRLDGFVLLPIHTQMASAIAGFYFGAGIVK
jgi:hypothetical protein